MTTIVEQIDKLQQIKNSIYQALIQKNIASGEVSFEQCASAIALAEKTDTLKYGCSIDCFLPKTTGATELVWNEHNGQFVFDDIMDVADEALSDIFRKKYHIVINEATFPSLKNISGNNATQYMFYDSTIQSVSFSELKKISGKYACFYMFGSCKNLKSVLLPKLEEISNNASDLVYCTYNMFHDCTQLQTVDLSSLIKCSGRYVIANMFRNCTKLTSVKLDNLQEISGDYAASGIFDGCASLTTISFPSLANIGDTSVFYNAFRNCSSLTEIHFRYDMRSVVESLTGYDTQFGATNATIYFDLGCSELEITPTPSNATVKFYDAEGTEIPNPTVTEISKYAWSVEESGEKFITVDFYDEGSYAYYRDTANDSSQNTAFSGTARYYSAWTTKDSNAPYATVWALSDENFSDEISNYGMVFGSKPTGGNTGDTIPAVTPSPIPETTITNTGQDTKIITYYTNKEIPSVGDEVYDSEGNLMTQKVKSISDNTITIG